jgi:hypothetical protein
VSDVAHFVLLGAPRDYISECMLLPLFFTVSMLPWDILQTAIVDHCR